MPIHSDSGVPARPPAVTDTTSPVQGQHCSGRVPAGFRNTPYGVTSTTPTWTLHPAEPDDIEQMAELRAVVMRPDPERLGRYAEHRVRPNFCLSPILQGHGIGTAVLRGLLERADAEGVDVRLDVVQGSAARRLYERHGFTLEREDPIDGFIVRPPGV